MGSHSHRQLKLKGMCKPYRHQDHISEKDIINNKIKTLQRYQEKIKNAELDELPNITNKLYNYLIKKSIIKDDIFIKNELISQIKIISNAYKNSYNPLEYQEVQEYLFNTIIMEEIKKLGNEPHQPINYISRTLKKTFHAVKYYIFKK